MFLLSNNSSTRSLWRPDLGGSRIILFIPWYFSLIFSIMFSDFSATKFAFSILLIIAFFLAFFIASSTTSTPMTSPDFSAADRLIDPTPQYRSRILSSSFGSK